MHGSNEKVVDFVVWDGGNYRSKTRDDDWETSKIQWQMAAMAVVTAEARITKERQDCKEILD